MLGPRQDDPALPRAGWLILGLGVAHLVERSLAAGDVVSWSGWIHPLLLVAVVATAPVDGWTRRRVLMGGALWWSIVAIAVATHAATTPTPRDLLASLVIFRTPDGALPGLEIGPLVLTAVLTLVVLRRWRSSNHVVVPVGLIAIGLAVQLIGGQMATWPLGHLHLVGLGLLARRWSAGLIRTDVRRPRLTSLLWITPGVVLLGDSAFDLIARQHVERVVLHSGRAIGLDGPVLPTFLWTVITASALGLVITAALAVAVGHGSFARRTSYALTATSVIALGFLVRLATLLTVAPTRTDGGDPLFYHSTANILAEGGGFPEPLNFIAFQRWIPSALHGPLYPIVLSISSRLGGTTYFDHKFVSLLIGTGVVALVVLVTRRITDSPLAAIVAGFLAAIYPNLWLVDAVLFPEGLMALCTMTVVYAAYRWWDRPAWRWTIVMGAVTGLATLARGEGLLLSVLLIVPWIALRRDLSWRRRIEHVALAAVACIVVLAPWAVRNARSFEAFVPLSTNGNELFVYANCDETYEGKFLGFWLFDCQEQIRREGRDAVGDEAEKSLYWREIGLDYARDNAGQLPKVLAARVLRQWDLFRPWQNADFAPIEGRDKDAARAGLVMYYGLAATALVGVRWLRRRQVRLLPLVVQFVSVTLTAAYAYGTTRFRIPAEPILCVLAGAGAVPIIRWLARRYARTPRDEPVDTTPFVRGGSVSWRTAFQRASVRSWIAVGSVAAAVGLALPALYRATGSTMEEGFMLVFPERVMNGDVANVDFLHLYGPGSLHWLSLWYRLFDVSLASERTFGLLQHLLVVSALFVLARPWGRAVAAVAAASSVVYVLTPIGLQALAWSGAVGLGLWSVVFAVRASYIERPARSVLISGLLAGVALTFRPDVVLALALALGFTPVVRRQWRALAGGLAIGLASFWIHLVQAGPADVFRGMVLEPVFDLRGGRELPRPPSWDHLDGALQVIGEKFAPWWGVPHIGAPKQLFLWFFALPIIAFGVVVVARRLEPMRRTALLAPALFGVGILPQALQRPDSAHFNWVAIVSWPLAVIAVVEIVRRRAPTIHPTVRTWIAGGSLLVTLAIVAPFFTLRTYGDLVVRSVSGDLSTLTVERNGRTFHLGDTRPWKASLEVIADLDAQARPSERLFVGPVDLRQTAYSDVFFYYLFPELNPATYFIEMDPGLANAEGSRLSADVASADWLVLTRFWSGWIEPNDSIVFGSDEPNQVVESSFCLRGSYQADVIRLYQRCDKGDGIGPYDPPYEPRVDYAVEVLVPVPPRPDGTCTPTCNGRPALPGEGFNPEEAAAITARAGASAP